MGADSMTNDFEGFDLLFPDDPGSNKAENPHNDSTISGAMNHADIQRLYDPGMEEAMRVSTPRGGQCWMKGRY